MLVFGTRPEAIKMAPVVKECLRRSDALETIVCSTGQHREMLDQVLQWFEIHVDERLDVMTPNQSLAELTSRCLAGLDQVLQQRNPHCVVAQGDTTTVLAAALAAFYRHLPFVHVEAGLRTGSLQAPWPEELNRRVADMVTTLHCAPTRRAAEVLWAEGTPTEAVRITGNTVIDALLATAQRQRREGSAWDRKYEVLQDRMVLITCHRRESFGDGLARICDAIGKLAHQWPDCDFVFPVHLNPNVHGPVHAALAGLGNVRLLPPAAYPEFVWLMDRSTLLLTDSGGVQEEAPSLKKPVLVMRDTTERPEAVETGAARLVGNSAERIVQEVSRLLSDPAAYAACQVDRNPYGDGDSAEKIVAWMLEQRWAHTSTT